MSLFTKKDAILQYDRITNNKKNIDLYLFQEDVDKNGKKQFLVKATKDIFTKMKDNRNNHYYEFWKKDTSLKFALDIDIPKDKISYEQSQDILKKNVTDTIYYAEQFYDHVYDISDVIVLETLPQELSSKKYSYHVIFDGLMFASHLVCKDFFRRMKEESEMFGCDESIYNLGCLRIMGSSKREKIVFYLQYNIRLVGKILK